MSINELTAFFGWMTVINLGIFLVAFIMLTSNHKKIIKFHKKLFHVSEDVMERAYVRHLSQYKLMILLFNLAPYIALRIMYGS